MQVSPHILLSWSNWKKISEYSYNDVRIFSPIRGDLVVVTAAKIVNLL